MHQIVLALKRFLVFLLGICVVWFVIFTFFPWFDQRLPLALTLLVTYCFIAYVGLPALVRLWQMLHKPTHVPTRSHERDGWAADPINLVILAKNEQVLTQAMMKAGWLVADPSTLSNSIRAVMAIILNRPYPNAPFDANYVFGKRQDLGFEIPVGSSPLKRHHVRFWQLGTTEVANEHSHHGFWRTLLAPFLHKKKQIWVGAASYDWGINARKRNLQFGHYVDPNTSAERDFLISTLQDVGALKETVAIKAGEPLHTKHQHFGAKIISDGYVTLCELKN